MYKLLTILLLFMLPSTAQNVVLGVSTELRFPAEGANRIGTWATPVVTPWTYYELGGSIYITAYDFVMGGTDVVVPDTLSGLPVVDFGYTFEGSQLTSITGGVNIAVIGEYAFWECGSFTSAVIEASCVAVGQSAFMACPLLTSVTWQGNAPAEGGSDIYGYSPSVINYVHAATTGWLTTFAGMPVIILNSPWTYSESSGQITLTGYNFSVGGTDVIIPDTLLGYPVIDYGTIFSPGYFGSEITSISGGANILAVATSAFQSCPALHTASLAYGVQSVGDSAFSGCPVLTTVVIPDSVTSLGASAFDTCYGLTTAYMGSGLAAPSYMSYVFSGCSSLTAVYWAGEPPASDGNNFSGITPGQVTNYVLPTTTGWGETFDGMPVVVLP